jgi:RNA polymerase-associated protein RTF1
LTKSGALINKFIPIERNRLNNLIKEANGRGDEEKVEALKKELETLDGPKLAYSTSMQPSPKKPSTQPGGISQQERLAIKNKENRRKNAEDVRQAQINERRAAKATEAAIRRGEVVVEDHSRRLRTRAKFKHDVTETVVKKTDSEASGTTTPVVGTPNLSAKKSTALPHLAKLQAASGNKNGLPTIRRPVMDDDIIGSIDFGIDIDIDEI